MRQVGQSRRTFDVREKPQVAAGCFHRSKPFAFITKIIGSIGLEERVSREHKSE